MIVKTFIGIDGKTTTKNPFPKESRNMTNLGYKNPFEKGTRENIAFKANFGSSDIYGITTGNDRKELQRLTAEMSSKEEAAKNTGANRGAVGSLGMSSGIGAVSNAQAGLVGSVNTEVQNDDNLLPYKKL